LLSSSSKLLPREPRRDKTPPSTADCRRLRTAADRGLPSTAMTADSAQATKSTPLADETVDDLRSVADGWLADGVAGCRMLDADRRSCGGRLCGVDARPMALALLGELSRLPLASASLEARPRALSHLVRDLMSLLGEGEPLLLLGASASAPFRCALACVSRHKSPVSPTPANGMGGALGAPPSGAVLEELLWVRRCATCPGMVLRTWLLLTTPPPPALALAGEASKLPLAAGGFTLARAAILAIRKLGLTPPDELLDASASRRARSGVSRRDVRASAWLGLTLLDASASRRASASACRDVRASAFEALGLTPQLPDEPLRSGGRDVRASG
jgi:hypothetical protein